MNEEYWFNFTANPVYNHITLQYKNNTKRVLVECNGYPMTWQAVIYCLKHNQLFVATFVRFLRNLPFRSFFIQTPPLTLDTVTCKACEFVIIESEPFYDKETDINKEDFQGIKEVHSVITRNRTRLISIIIPKPRDREYFNNFGDYIRNASLKNICDFFSIFSSMVKVSLNSRPIWITTTNCDFDMFHFRIERDYSHILYSPYKSIAAQFF